MFRKFGGLPWQLFFKEKPEFSTPEGEVLVCHFEKANKPYCSMYFFIDSVQFFSSLGDDSQWVFQYGKYGDHFLKYDRILTYFNSPSVKPLLQDWIFTELDKAIRTTEEMEPFKTLSLYVGASDQQLDEEGQESLSRRYEKLLRESYIPAGAKPEIEIIMSESTTEEDPIPYNVRAFFQHFIDLGIITENEGERPYKLKKGYKAEDFSHRASGEISQGRVNKVMNLDEYYLYVARVNGIPYKNPKEFNK